MWLDALTEEALQTHARDYLGAYGPWRSNPRDGQARQAWFDTLEATITWLRETVMQPLHEALPEGAAPITLIPTSYLALLPLHAADPEHTFTYAPNARALAAARETAAHISPPYSLLAIDNPDGSLHFSDEEVAAALDAFDQTRHLANARATASAVQAALSQHDVWHFSTHGRAGWEQPLEGGLLLAQDAVLTLRDLLQMQGARARLAVLSACETGVPGIDLPDEVIGLPTGLLQAGVAGIVGSLWAVNDLSTALLMVRFYEAWREEGQAPPDALHTAQVWLRESTNAEFQAYFKAQLPELTGERMPHDVASGAYHYFMLRTKDEDARPFAHPFYWAGFYYTGV